jgi:thioredoxin-related protein
LLKYIKIDVYANLVLQYLLNQKNLKQILMKSFFILVLVCISGTILANRLESAEQKAKTEHKFILLNFSGSDWCGPCIRMTREVLGNEDFQKFVTSNLVFINADFPRSQKHRLSPEIKKENDELAEKYNAEGTFPCTMLLDSNGKVIYTWKGFYDKGASSFTSEVKELVDKNR